MIRREIYTKEELIFLKSELKKILVAKEKFYMDTKNEDKYKDRTYSLASICFQKTEREIELRKKKEEKQNEWRNHIC